MKKMISLLLIGFILTGCSFVRIHRMDIEQGNVITEAHLNQIHRGMTEAEVKNIMGEPVLTNIFTRARVEYVYTYQPGYGMREEKRLTCIFRHGILQEKIVH